MDDFVKTLPIPTGTGATSDGDSDNEEALEFGFKWDGSSSEDEVDSDENSEDEPVSGAHADAADSGASDADDASSDDESDESVEDEDEGSDVELDEVPAGAVEDDNDPEQSEAESVEEAKIPRYKPGTKERVPEFSELHLSRPLLRAVKEMKYQVPTTIQWKTIPAAMGGHDVCGSAQTGSGKTAAFLLPALERLLLRDKRFSATRVVVVLPTRELASQCYHVCCKLAQFTDVRTCLAVGGLSLKAQETELRKRPDIVIGTPGRLLDLVKNSPSIHFDDVEVLILDEADKLLEMGFKEEVLELVKTMPVDRQTLFFSATMTSKVEELAAVTLKKPVNVQADPLFDVSDKLAQEFVRVRESRESDREAMILSLVTTTFKRGVIVFFGKKQQAHRMCIIMSLLGLNCGELHGNLTQQQRLDAFEDFAEGKIDVLLATDLAGRGLDMKGVKVVINFEMPRSLTTYVHRIGRTARAGRSGRAITLTGEGQRSLMKQIVKHAAGTVKARVIPNEDIESWKAKIRAQEPAVRERYKQERIEKEVRIAEMEANKAANMIEHEDEIQARPARSWFMSGTQKQALKDATKFAVTGEVPKPKDKTNTKKRGRMDSVGSDGDDDSVGEFGGGDSDSEGGPRKGKGKGKGKGKDKGKRGKSKDKGKKGHGSGERDQHGQGHRLTRKKRRQLEAKSIGFASKSVIKAAKRKNNPTRMRKG